jgi:RNA polymerase sigma factor for flagellar operon FliA
MLPPRPARRRPASGTQRIRTKNAGLPKAAVAVRIPRKTALTAKTSSAQKQRMTDALAAELLARYSSLVRQIAGGFQRRLPRSVLREDLVAAGMSGLWDAIRRHAEKPGDSFDWYVRVRIRGAILDELRAQDWLPRRARAAAAEANEAGDMSVTAPSVVRFDDVSEWEQNRSLTAPESNSEAAVEAKFVRETLARAVEQLPERERHIVSAHYFQGVKFKDLGAELGVSEPRISQLHSRAMQRLKTLMNEAA